MDYTKYINSVDGIPLLKRFAYLGKTSDFNNKLRYLAKIAEPEEWGQLNSLTQQEFSTLFYYVIYTFDRCYKQEKIFIDDNEEFAFFNTGLIDLQGNEIYGKFEKNSFYDTTKNHSNYWYFRGFFESNNREFYSKCPTPPELATYYEDYNELYFDPNLQIEINFNHIYDDNFERLPQEFSTLDKEIARLIIDGAIKLTKKKIMRNNRIPVPQFYNEKLMFLVPLKVFGKKTIVIALEKMHNMYVANTVLSLPMAYNCARLLNKPESEWLLTAKE
jgi:hypothetical protein